MKILFVAPWVPGKQRPRSLGLLRLLSERHDVHVVAACWDTEDMDQLRGLGVPSTAVPLSRYSATCRAVLACFTPRRSLQQAFVDAHEMNAQVSQLVHSFEPDLLYYNVIRSAQLHRNTYPPGALDLDEFRSQYYAVLSRSSSSPLQRILGAIEAPRMRRAESVALRAFDKVLVSSPMDLSPRHSHIKLVRSPHALPMRKSDAATSRTAGGIVFVGRMSYRPNVEGITWFCREVMPLLVEAHPSVHLDIVGADPARRVRALASSHVTVHGRVPEVVDFYRRSQVSVVPVTIATGVQMKLIESLATGTPTVVSDICARQAGVTNQLQCLTATTASDWVGAVLKILTDSALAERLAQAAATWADKTYGHDAIAASLTEGLALD